MAAALMAALPFALAWWILPAVPLARELFEQYALLTGVGPVSRAADLPGARRWSRDEAAR